MRVPQASREIKYALKQNRPLIVRMSIPCIPDHLNPRYKGDDLYPPNAHFPMP